MVKSVKENLDALIQSVEFENFCNQTQCTIWMEGCREFCPLFRLKKFLGA